MKEKELYIAVGLLILGGIALGYRASRAPYDFRRELMTSLPSKPDSLAFALEKALQKKNEESGQSKAPSSTK